MSKGEDTGVKIEVRSGGPAIGFQTVTSQLYADPAIMLGYVSTDEALQHCGDFPTKAVVAPFNINPQIIMWDPATYPQVKAIKDLKPLGVKVRYFGGAAYMDYLIQSGQLDKSQTDGSYDGTPANFVAAGGKDAQQGFASAEPYFYEKVLKDWGKPIAYQLIHDAGWTAYAQSLAATPGQLREVPGLLQEAGADHPAVAGRLRQRPRRGPTRSSSTWSSSTTTAGSTTRARPRPPSSSCSRTSWWPTAPTARWAASTWTG